MRRWLLVLAGALILAVGLVVLVGVFGARDESGVEGGADPTPGTAVTDHCAAAFGDPALARELLRGNVLVAYSDTAQRAALERLRDDLAGPPSAVLEDAGQAVILRRRADLDGISARAWARRVDVRTAADPRLAELIERELGRGGPASAAAC
jgi:hypothetical protein